MKAAQTGVDLIAAERRRQIEELGYDAANDRGYKAGELATVAALYATPRHLFERIDEGLEVRFVDAWPDGWDHCHDKRRPDVPNEELSDGERIDLLAKAGALIAAEIDRLQAVGKKAEKKGKQWPFPITGKKGRA